MKHLGDSVVREHGDLIDVMERAKALALEAGPEVCDEDLGALVETHGGAFEFVTVV